jgi:Ni,Fe-hydrogenase III small subunit
MSDLLRTRLAQGRQTLAFPWHDVALPERFRGRPELNCAGCGNAPCPAHESAVPSALITRDERGHARLDVGACLFSPEEAVGTGACGVSFTHDHRLSSRTRNGFVSPSGEIELASALDAQIRRLFARSLRLRSVVAGSCGGCEAELAALSNVVFDMARFGIQFVASPRHADGIVITGAVNTNMRDALEQTYAAVAEPKIVIAVGACAINGGPFRGSDEAASGVEAIVPVDLWIAGCPPHPLTLLDGMLRLLGRIERGEARAEGAEERHVVQGER